MVDYQTAVVAFPALRPWAAAYFEIVAVSAFFRQVFIPLILDFLFEQPKIVVWVIVIHNSTSLIIHDYYIHSNIEYVYCQ